MNAATTLAFDRLAADYDALTGGEIFRHLRARVHHVYARQFARGSRVLEIGCGTGVDTHFLAAHGVRVVACDPSEEMVSRTLRRLAGAGLDRATSIVPCGLEDLETYLEALGLPDTFHGIVSNFGALNCVPSLSPLGVIGARHLRPGGVAIIGLIGRTCLWETFYFMARGDAVGARRRRAPIVAVPVAGVDVPTFYHRTTDVRAGLGEAFRLDTCVGIGVAVPPPYLELRWQRIPAPLRRAAARVDRVAGAWPIVNRLGDHSLTCWLKRRVAHA